MALSQEDRDALIGSDTTRATDPDGKNPILPPGQPFQRGWVNWGLFWLLVVLTVLAGLVLHLDRLNG